MPLPDFVIIAPMKSGTTTLDSNLRKHPEIGMSEFKEPNYFTSNFHRPLKWYENLFPKNKERLGEASPSYAKRHFYPNTAKRMFDILPDAKLIFIARDPVDRIISHLHHDLYRDRLKITDLNKIVFSNPDYIQASRYFYQMSAFLEYYRKENILFLPFDSLKQDLSETLNIIVGFLELPDFFIPEKLVVTNQTSRKYLIKYFDKAHKFLPENTWKIYHYIFYFLNIKIHKPILDNGTLVKIKEILKDDIDNYKALTGEDFLEWKTYNNIS